jgi:hypothetical protein
MNFSYGTPIELTMRKGSPSTFTAAFIRSRIGRDIAHAFHSVEVGECVIIPLSTDGCEMIAAKKTGEHSMEELESRVFRVEVEERDLLKDEQRALLLEISFHPQHKRGRIIARRASTLTILGHEGCKQYVSAQFEYRPEDATFVLSGTSVGL